MVRALALLVLAFSAYAQQPRQLVVSVRFEDAFESPRREVQRQIDQRVMVMDGRRATILTGESRPTRRRQYIQTPLGPVPQETVVVQERTAGFDVIPHLRGDRVAMEVVSASTAQIVTGPLGEWFELGAIGARRVWAKVETLDR